MQSVRTTHPPILLPRVLTSCMPPYLTDAIMRCGAPIAEEIRLHSNRRTFVTATGKSYPTSVTLSKDEIAEILKKMCRDSLYAYSQTINQGYLTMEGGIRVGVCGSAAIEKEQIIGVTDITGLIVRIPHAPRVSLTQLCERLRMYSRPPGIQIYAPPGIGKTTLLRALAAELSSPACGYRTVAVDTRGELNFTLDGADLNLDILVGYPRDIGIGIAVRSLGAEIVICDEIGSTEDARAILSASNCGVPLIASAHARDIGELLRRPAISLLHRAHVFELYTGIRRCSNGFSYQFTDWKDAYI